MAQETNELEMLRRRVETLEGSLQVSEVALQWLTKDAEMNRRCKYRLKKEVKELRARCGIALAMLEKNQKDFLVKNDLILHLLKDNFTTKAVRGVKREQIAIFRLNVDGHRHTHCFVRAPVTNIKQRVDTFRKKYPDAEEVVTVEHGLTSVDVVKMMKTRFRLVLRFTRNFFIVTSRTYCDSDLERDILDLFDKIQDLKGLVNGLPYCELLPC